MAEYRVKGDGFDFFFHPSVVAVEETAQFWCVGITGNGDVRFDVAHKCIIKMIKGLENKFYTYEKQSLRGLFYWREK